MTDTEDTAERKHWNEVLRAYREYTVWMQGECHRREAAASQVPERYRAMLPSGVFQYKANALQQAVANNQTLLNAIAQDQESHGFRGDGEALPWERTIRQVHPDGRPRSTPAHFSKVKSTLHQMVRDWAEEGAAERQACYGPMVEQLRKMIPLTQANRNRVRVLVPGCGLGRLPFDLACEGYAAQGSEFSYFMLFASNFILNGGIDMANIGAVHPFIHDPSNHVKPQDMFRPVRWPDVPPATLLDINPDADFSMVAGEFTDVYGRADQESQWDAILTCFFLDTAPTLFEYLETIWHCLKPGGAWVNLGPLLYHWQNAENEGGMRPGRRQEPHGHDHAGHGHGHDHGGPDGGWGAAAAGRAAGRDEDDGSEAGSADGGAGGSADHDPLMSVDDPFGLDEHGVDRRYRRSLELSYAEIRHAIQAFGFKLVHEARAPSTTYASNRLSLMKVVYQPLLFTVVKPEEGEAGAGAAPGAAATDGGNNAAGAGQAQGAGS